MNIKTITTYLFFITIESCHIHGSFLHIPKRILLATLRNHHTEKNPTNKITSEQFEIIKKTLDISEQNIINDIERITTVAQKLSDEVLTMGDIKELINIPTQPKRPSCIANYSRKLLGLDIIATNINTLYESTATKQDLLDTLNEPKPQDNTRSSQ